MGLSEKVKNKLIDEIYQSRRRYIDECAKDIAIYGCALKDMYEMTDKELIEEYRDDVIHDDVDPLLQEAEAEMVIHEILTEDM